MELAQATRGPGLKAADLSGATLSQSGGALIVRLVDGRVVVVPGFFPHEPSPLPADAAPPDAILLAVDQYYAVVAGAPSDGDASAEGSAVLTLEQLGALAPAAGPDGSANGPPSALAGLRGDAAAAPGPIQLASLATGAAATAGSSMSDSARGPGGFATSGADAAPAAGAIAGNGSGGTGSFGGATGGGATGGGFSGAGAGPQPPGELALLFGGGVLSGVGSGLGTIAAGGSAARVDAPPQSAVVAGSTSGGGFEQAATLIEGGTFELSADPLGFHVVRIAGGPLEDIFVDYRRGGLAVLDPKSATLLDPEDWMLLRFAAFDATPTDATSRFSFSAVPGGGLDSLFYFPARELGFTFDASMPGFSAIDRYSVFGNATITLGDPHDPKLVSVIGVDGPAGSSAVASATNDYDFVGIDGSKFHGINGIDAANGVASTIRIDLAFIDAMVVGISAPDAGSPFAGSAFNVIAIAADATDSVVFADPQNWQFHGIDANGLVQYRAGGPGTFQIVEMPVALAAKPAYDFAGGAGADTLILPDMGFGAIDGGGGINALRLQSGSFDFTALGAGRSIANLDFIDAVADPAANLIRVDAPFVNAAAHGFQLTLTGGTNDRVAITDLLANWTERETFRAAPDGTTHDFVRYAPLAGGAQLVVQAELAQDLPVVRTGGAGFDFLTVQSTPRVQLIDGKDGFDVIVPEEPGALDLGALVPGSSIVNVEAVDLRQGAHALTLDDVFVADGNVDRIFSVLGNADDDLTLAGGWTKTGSFTSTGIIGGNVFDRWQATAPGNVAVTLFVDADVQLAVQSVP